MTRPQSSVSRERGASRPRRSRATVAAFLVGVPLAAGILSFIRMSPSVDPSVRRYVSHPVECVEVFMFCGALGALATKLWSCRAERRACRAEVLPHWDGTPVAVSEATKSLAGLGKLPRFMQHTLIVKRAVEVLEFLCRRGSAAELDDRRTNGGANCRRQRGHRGPKTDSH